MTKRTFELLVLAAGLGFTVAFVIIVVPPLLQSGDIIGAFGAGFVNPYASGYSLDTILCGVILAIWVLYERSAHGVTHGWIVLPVILVPGVATAFALYLVIRSRSGAASNT